VLEAFAQRGVTALVTTHYERLKALGAADERFANASVGFDMEKLEPTFKLHLGVPGSSGALVVARRMGMPGDVVERAAVILGDAGLSVENLLSSVAEQRRRLEHERAQQLAEIEALEAERMALRLDRERARVRGDKEQSRAHSDALSALRQARQEIDHVRSDLRKKAQAEKASVEDVKQARRTLVRPGAAVAANAPAASMPPGKRATEADLVPGTPVLVPGLGGRGHVAAAPERGKVEVQLGGMHMTVDVSAVLIDSHRAASRAASERKPEPAKEPAPQADVQLVDGANDGRATARTPGTTLDLRGQRVEEALANVDRWLDEQLLLGHDAVFIVHGHGTGVLRAAIREKLATHPAARRARPGEASEGGDGVTVVLLRD
jgi:DNA mismatch repair protein MutS2